jgi:hypothetical protein
MKAPVNGAENTREVSPLDDCMQKATRRNEEGKKRHGFAWEI